MQGVLGKYETHLVWHGLGTVYCCGFTCVKFQRLEHFGPLLDLGSLNHAWDSVWTYMGDAAGPYMGLKLDHHGSQLGPCMSLSLDIA